MLMRCLKKKAEEGISIDTLPLRDHNGECNSDADATIAGYISRK